MNIELEIKLTIPDLAIPLFKQHPLLQKTICPPAANRLISTYFDTPDKLLRKQGYVLRIRQVEESFIQTLKGRAADQAGITARYEWEWPLTAFALDLSLISLPDLQPLLNDRAFIQSLAPRFTTDFIRKTWDIELSDKTTIEIALDQGIISTGECSTPLQELEFELKRGNPETLKAVARLFEIELALTTETRSKAARGFALC